MSDQQMSSEATQHTHPTSSHQQMADCPACLVKPGASKSSRVAWGVAVVALLLLATVLLLRPGSIGGSFAGAGGLILLGVLICPLTMGAMMFLMMRKGH